MRNIKITYAYDGSDFYGFQRQPDKRTVQGEIERVLKIILKATIRPFTKTHLRETKKGEFPLWKINLLDVPRNPEVLL